MTTALSSNDKDTLKSLIRAGDVGGMKAFLAFSSRDWTEQALLWAAGHGQVDCLNTLLPCPRHLQMDAIKSAMGRHGNRACLELLLTSKTHVYSGLHFRMGLKMGTSDDCLDVWRTRMTDEDMVSIFGMEVQAKNWAHCDRLMAYLPLQLCERMKTVATPEQQVVLNSRLAADALAQSLAHPASAPALKSRL